VRNTANLSLSDKVLVAATTVAAGEVTAEFTAEDLVVAVWKSDNVSFGLRGHEKDYPDNNKVYTKIDGKSGLVSKGMLAKAGERTLRVTPAGLAYAAQLGYGVDPEHSAKLDRAMHDAVRQVLSHPEFLSWLKDPSSPSRFRGAGHFWGIAPGTPPDAVRARVMGVERTLKAALAEIERRGLTEVIEQRGRILFDRHDLERALAFQQAIRTRFCRDLRRLDPGFEY
jgi:hypothetical protein